MVISEPDFTNGTLKSQDKHQDVHDTPCTAHHVPTQANKMSMTRHAQLITSLAKATTSKQDVHDTPCTAHHVPSESNDK
eukprot:g70761.t1